MVDARRTVGAWRAFAEVHRNHSLTRLAFEARQTIASRIAVKLIAMRPMLAVLLVARIVGELAESSVEARRAFTSNIRVV